MSTLRCFISIFFALLLVRAVPQDALFQRQINDAMKRVREVLERNKHPLLAGDVTHEYDDKYLLVEFLGNLAIESTSIVLQSLGFASKQLMPLVTGAANRTVSLRFDAHERCEYLRMETRSVESPTHVVEVESQNSHKTTKKHKTLTTITDYFWKVVIAYDISLCVGGDSDDCLSLPRGHIASELRTSTNTSSPLPHFRKQAPITLDATFYMKNVEYLMGSDEDELLLRPKFHINRKDAACHTPVRNKQSEGALEFFANIKTWARRVEEYVTNQISSLSAKRNELISIVKQHDIFVPILPYMMPLHNGGAASELLMNRAAVASLLEDEEKSLHRSLLILAEQLPPDNDEEPALLSSKVAQIAVALRHVCKISEQAAKSILYVEDLLRQQLIAAIGREVTPSDVELYMQRRYRQLFRQDFAPQPLTRAIRRSQTHSPEGIVSFEISTEGASMSSPLYTVTRRLQMHSANTSREVVKNASSTALSIALDSSTSVSLTGNVFLHGALLHHFSQSSTQSLTLCASARQFSSYILLLGRIPSSSAFVPSHAIIVKNKDSLRIPVDIEVIPSHREFVSAIASMSEEQQEFAKAIRALQMESTLFGICVIQIKPQLEKVLNMPQDSLTKQIELTEHLMELFIEYQIPVDLLSVNDAGSDKLTEEHAIQQVKRNVDTIQSMINRAKEKELKEKSERDEYERDALDRLKRMKVHAYGSEPMFMEASLSGATFHGDVETDNVMHRRLRGGKGEPSEPSTSPSGVPSDTVEEHLPSEPETLSDTTSFSLRRDSVDITSLPDLLQQTFEDSHHGNIIRPAILTPSSQWTRRRQHNLFSAPNEDLLSENQHCSEKSQAFDLLDALTKSGGIAIAESELHIVVASAHVFDKNLVDTVIQANVNPVQKLEQSIMIMASTILGMNASDIYLSEL